MCLAEGIKYMRTTVFPTPLKSKPQIRGLQAQVNLLTVARHGGNINMDQSETEVRRQAMTQRMGRSADELVARDAVKSGTTFTATEDDRHLDVM